MSLLITEWRCLSQEHQRGILQQRAIYEELWMTVLERAKAESIVDGDVFILRRTLAGSILWTTTGSGPMATCPLKIWLLKPYAFLGPREQRND